MAGVVVWCNILPIIMSRDRPKSSEGSWVAAYITFKTDSNFDDLDFSTSFTRISFEELCQDLFCSTLERRRSAPIAKSTRSATSVVAFQ